MTPERRKTVLAALNSRSIKKAWEAGQSIWADPDPALLRGVVWTMRRGRSQHNRVEAAYRLRTMPGTTGIATCERILKDKKASKQLRAHVAETLANRHRPASHDVLLRTLKSESSPEMRFWCAFALGFIQERRALPTLRRLAETDHRVVKGWWRVSKEARDAIGRIEHPDAISKVKRPRRCIFCRPR